MRNAVTGLVLLMIIVLSGAAILTVETKTTRQNELDMNLGSAMEQTLKGLAADGSKRFGGESGKELEADFIENFLMRTTSNSVFQIDVLEADAKKGVLDVRVTERFRQITGEGKAEARKTVILEQYDQKGDVFCQVSFRITDKGEENIVKQVRMQENAPMQKAFFPSADPDRDGYVFQGWMLVGPDDHAEKGQIYTKENADKLVVSSDLILEAVFARR